MPRVFEAAENGFGLEHHALATAKGPVIDGAVTVVGEEAEVVRVDRRVAGCEGAAEDAVIQNPREEVGEDGQDVERHAGSAPARLSSTRPGGQGHLDAFFRDGKRDQEALHVGDEDLVRRQRFRR